MFNSSVLSVLFVGVLIVVVTAAPSYVLVPLEEYEAMSGRGARVVRQAWAGAGQDQAQEQDGRVERQAHGHGEHVDYGAHTGHHGAFGWYADFPVTTHH